MFKKFINYSETYESIRLISMFLLDLDSENYQKVIDRACELYNGRKNRK